MCFYFSHTNRKLVKPYHIPSFEPSSTWFQCFYPGVNLYSQLPWCPTIKQIDRVSFWRWCFRSWGSEDRLSHLWFFKFEKHHLNLERECIEEEGQGRKPCCIIGRSLSPQSTGRNSSSPQARSDSLQTGRAILVCCAVAKSENLVFQRNWLWLQQNWSGSPAAPGCSLR